MTIGIYCIENKVNNHKYVGKAVNVEKRMKNHVYCLRGNYHNNDYLQKSWNKYGEDNFRFYLIEQCGKNMIEEKEKYYIDKLNTLRPNGYNLTLGGEGTIGYKHSDSTRKKMKESHVYFKGENNPNYGKHLSIESKQKISVTKTGSKQKKATSKYVGVSFCKSRNKWVTSVYYNKKVKTLGHFNNEVFAAVIRDLYVLENNINLPLNFKGDFYEVC